MTIAFASDLTQEEHGPAGSPRIQNEYRTGKTIANASPQDTITIILPAVSSTVMPRGLDSPGASTSSAAVQPSVTYGVRAPRSPALSPTAPAWSSRKTPAKPSKIRGSSLFTFLGVKEPSQQAFEEYERRMRAKGAANDGRIISSGIPGLSSAKMPAMVPRVNSHWDGVPRVVKSKGKEKKSGGQAPLGKHHRSLSTAGSNESKATMLSTNSGSSSGHQPAESSRFNSSTSLSDLYGWESANSTNNSRDRLEVAPVKRAHKGTVMSKRSRKTYDPSRSPRHSPLPESYLDTELPPLPAALSHTARGWPLPNEEILPESDLDTELPPLPAALPQAPRGWPLPNEEILPESDLDTELPSLPAALPQALCGWPLPNEEILPDLPAQSFTPTNTSAESSPVTPCDCSPITYELSRQAGPFADQHDIKTTTLLIPAHGEVLLRPLEAPILDPPGTSRRRDKKPPPGSETPAVASPVEKWNTSDEGRWGVGSTMTSPPPPDSSAQVEISAEPEPKMKKRHILPSIFGK